MDTQLTRPVSPAAAEAQRNTNSYPVELAPAPPPDPGPPADPILGRYVLGPEVARGGMGVVYAARDTRLNRDVAVKVLRNPPGPHQPRSAERFLAEAQITAQLQHPGIPPVHDHGQLPDGRPFLAMKLVRGRTLVALLKDRPDPAADRGRFVDVFERVCQAVACAHSQGVVHRDLKPSNVMVGAFGEVQVMDWGLAKVLAAAAPAPDGDDPDGRVHTVNEMHAATVTGAVLGTPAYMAPEQARGEPADARTDVFGLGAILCEVLTGRPPVDGANGEAIVRNAARGDLAGAAARLAACGGEAELINLCGRCLAADPAARPADGRAVAEAVAAFRAAAADRARRAELDGVAARVRAAEEGKRWRTLYRVGGLALAAVLAGGLLAGWQWWRAARALAGETEGRVAAAAALAAGEAARDDTLAALRQLTGPLVEDHVARRPPTDQDRAFLRDVLRMWEGLAAARGDDPAARALRAEGQAKVAAIHHRLGAFAAAEAGLRAAIDVLDGLAAERPADPAFAADLASARHLLGLVLYDTGRPAEAERMYRVALAARSRLAAEHPHEPRYRGDVARTRTNLGLVFAETRRPIEAEVEYRAAAAAWEEFAAADPGAALPRRELARLRSNLGVVYVNSGRRPDAEREYRAALAGWEALAAADPVSPDYRNEVTRVRNNLCFILVRSGRGGEAGGLYRAALDDQSRLVADFPAVPGYRNMLARTLVNLAYLRTEEGAFADARDLIARARLHLAAALGANPGDPVAREIRRNAVRNEGRALLGLGDHARAAAAAEELVRVAFDPADDAYLAAGYAARCAALAGGDGRYAALAVDLLRRAAAAGFRDAGRLRADAAFAPLRDRADFREVAAAVGAGPRPAAPPPRPAGS